MVKIMKKQKSLEKSPKPSIGLIKRIVMSLVFGTVLYFGWNKVFVASVNGQYINRLSILKELEKQGGQKVLDTTILKTLINQEAKKRKVNVSEKELTTELLKIESNVTSQGTTLEALLLQQGMTKKDLEGEIRIQLLVTKMVDNKISVTEKEIDDYLNSQKEQISLTGIEETTELTRDQAKEAIKQQKTQEKIQTFVTDLKAKAKISYFVKY